MVKALYEIATRFVAKASPRSSQKMKRSESDDPTTQTDYFSSSRGERASDESLYTDSNTHTMTSFVSSFQMTYDPDPILTIKSINRHHSNRQEPTLV